MTAPNTAGTPAEAAPEPFQFRIRDLLLVMLLVGLAAGALVQQSGFLLLLLLGVGAYSLWLWRAMLRPMRLVHVLLCAVIVAMLIGLFLPAVQSTRPVGKRTMCANNLKQIVIALHNYHDMFGSFPPSFIADSSGRPMHSWRVLILPFLEQKPLYDQYRFDEPWDGPNNRKLHDKIMCIYSCPSDHGQKQSLETSYVAIVGPHTAWPADKATTLDTLPDGPADVLLVVEVHNSGIHWLEPRDLHVTQMTPTINAPHGQGISSAHKGGAQAAMADGTVRFLPEALPAEAIRSRVQIDDGTRGELP